MNFTRFLLAKCVLAIALIAVTACGEKKSGKNEVVGEWLGRTVTTKRDGHADETKTYAANEFEMKFLPDGTFMINDRGVPNEPTTLSGTYEVTSDHRLKQTVLQASGGPKIVTDAMKGRTVVMDLKVSSDQLSLVMHLVDKAGKSMGTTESTFVRAPQ
jgi:hypothetical protein